MRTIFNVKAFCFDAYTLYICIVFKTNTLRKRILKVKHKYIKIKHYANKENEDCLREGRRKKANARVWGV